MMMRIRSKLNLRTKAEWDALPDSDKLEWMAWDIYRQMELKRAYDLILESSKPRPDPHDSGGGSISPEVHTLLFLASLTSA